MTNSDFCLFQYIYGMKQVAKCLFLVFCELLRIIFLFHAAEGLEAKGAPCVDCRLVPGTVVAHCFDQDTTSQGARVA